MRRIRKSFSKCGETAQIPNLIQVQQDSYSEFLQSDVSPENRSNSGLESVFRSIFPISDYDENAVVEYVKYELCEPKYDCDECIQRGVSYSAPLKVTLRLIVWDIDEELQTKEIKGIKEQDVYMGDVPLMTESGTFIISGAQRVIVSQMHRSPGVFFSHDEGKNNVAGKYLYSARIIPYRGSWIDFEFDSKDLLFFRIDRKRKLYATTLLYALGYTREQMLEMFYEFKAYHKKNGLWITKFSLEDFKGVSLTADIIDFATNEVLIARNTKVTPRVLKKIKENIANREDDIYYIASKDMMSNQHYLARPVFNIDGERQIFQSGIPITESIIESIDEEEIDLFYAINTDELKTGPYICNTLLSDKNTSYEDALSDIYKVLRPGESFSVQAAEKVLHASFFDDARYNLSEVGRMKINFKHSLNFPNDLTILTKEDIRAVIKHLIDVKDGVVEPDDIDSLVNRRVRAVGELVENQFRLGLIRMERTIVERMNAADIDAVMPNDLINSKVLMSVIREFFGTSQLSQFMDQTNPLAEVTHKRRLSALGPGGLTRERAGFEVRDVHPSHYGRICPIETPEGPNIGLINSIATYARINKYGFIESPYRKVIDGKVTDTIEYLSALEESKYTIAQANIELASDGSFVDEIIHCRRSSEFTTAQSSEIHYVDVSSKQLVSVAASLIPFLENDDANRALMGSNMQRQAIPLLKSEAPFVGTGMEGIVARDSASVVLAKRSGIVEKVDSRRIVIKTMEEGRPGIDIYTLTKFSKSNQGTFLNQIPIVKVGDKVKGGDVIADGSSTSKGELALGKNVLVAFLTWNGYNFEDSILVSERLVRDDVFTSIRIKEFEIVARDTRLGPEEITRDIPNVSEENLRHLDEVGIVNIGAKVGPGDILVGKVTPKHETQLAPEEKLLRAIFGEKSREVRNSSLYVPPSEKGVVVGVRVYTRRGVEKDGRAISLEHMEMESITKDYNDQLKIIQNFAFDKIKDICVGRRSLSQLKNINIGDIFSEENIAKVPVSQWGKIIVEDSDAMNSLLELHELYEKMSTELENTYKRKLEKVQNGDDLQQGALKIVKVYIATKLKLQAGDKMAGRHGNKGVVSRIVPAEDMPFLEDGTPIDIALNPLGVPSRMNIGQILEIHLGLVSFNFGRKVNQILNKFDSSTISQEEFKESFIQLCSSGINVDSDTIKYLGALSANEIRDFAKDMSRGAFFTTSVFDGIKEQELDLMLEKSGASKSGQVKLRDGKTGEYFDRDVTVGYLYMLKLDHLAEDKMHSRSIGPYSLVTQQPLGGKAHFGGQRFGEMECWALEAYGAAHTLQEMLTVKSDDAVGRVKMYESIVRDDMTFESGIPESCNVMIKELRSLCLDIELSKSDSDSSSDDKLKNIQDKLQDRIKVKNSEA